MDIIMNLVAVVLREGFIYGIMAMGVYITYKVLDFPDLSVDGTFPLGACASAALITMGVNPLLACLVCFVAGAGAGLVTGLLHVELKITDLLSGILVMTALYSVNMLITSKKAILSIFNMDTIFNTGLGKVLYDGLGQWGWVLMAALVCLISKLILDLYLSTKSGLLLRAAGSNPVFVTALGRDPGNVKILGLMIGNGLTALAGAVLTQQKESADVNSGTGMVVMALAAVILGEAVFGKAGFLKGTSTAVLGMIIYRAGLTIAMQLGLDTVYLRALMTGLFIIALLIGRRNGKKETSVLRSGL